MFRYIQSFKLLIIAMTLTLSSAMSHAYDLQRGGGGGGDVPWPWGLEVPFPWEDVQGVWKVENKGQTMYFGFRRVADKRLFVTQFDADRCMTIGSGPGLIRSKAQKYVVSQITMFSTGDVYRMAIYAFAEQDTSLPPSVTTGDGEPEHVVVARITNISHSGSRELALQLVRISDRMEFKCLGQDKKLKF